MATNRIDFHILTNGQVVVQKFTRCAGVDVLASSEEKPQGFDLETAIAWCQEHGYTVRRWHRGVRAWKGATPWTIRTRYQIWRKRQALERQTLADFRRNPGRCSPADCLLALDLAYDG